VRLPPPLLGEHNDEVLSSWLEMKSEAIDQLKKKSVI
jgi:crotonobetainyl-CoA:carnitine CoA-transferase CaiB-like acyl-CoA transferase